MINPSTRVQSECGSAAMTTQRPSTTRGLLGLTLLLVGPTTASAADPPPHPRIFFDPSDVARLRERARTTHAAIARNIIRQADALLQKPVPDRKSVV